jgi:S-adenosylmethionine hydrolase
LLLIGPDNGLFSLLLRDDPTLEAIELDEARFHLHPVSATFHGRDIFAPVAAHAAVGVAFADLGSPIEVSSLVTLALPEPVFGEDEIAGHVVHIDGFGNLITDLGRTQVEEWTRGGLASVRAGERTMLLRVTFGDVDAGEPLAYFGSTGRLEIAVRNGSAADVLGLGPEAVITVSRRRHR